MLLVHKNYSPYSSMYWSTSQSAMATISATTAVRLIMLFGCLLCQYGQTEQIALVQAHQVGPLNSIISVCYYLCACLTIIKLAKRK